MAVTLGTATASVQLATTRRTITLPGQDVRAVCATGASRSVTQVDTNRVCVNFVNPSVTQTRASGLGSALEITLVAAVAILRGQPIYVTNDGKLNLAGTNIPCIGVATDDVRARESVAYISDGSVVRSDWSDVAGDLGLLPGRTYYLTDTGMLTNIPPSTGISQQVGIAASRYMLDVEIGQPIQLA